MLAHLKSRKYRISISSNHLVKRLFEKKKNLGLVFGVSQTERLCSSLVRQGRYRNRSYRKPIVSFTRSFTGLVICLCKIAISFCCKQIQKSKLLFDHCGTSYWQLNDKLVTAFGTFGCNWRPLGDIFGFISWQLNDYWATTQELGDHIKLKVDNL